MYICEKLFQNIIYIYIIDVYIYIHIYIYMYIRMKLFIQIQMVHMEKKHHFHRSVSETMGFPRVVKKYTVICGCFCFLAISSRIGIELWNIVKAEISLD